MSGSLDRVGHVEACPTPGPTTAAVQALGYADRLTLDVVQHGSLDGYRAGCRAELACPGRAGGLSCLAVGIRYAGDWAFRRLVDDGATPAEAAERIAAEDRAARRGPARAQRPRRRRSEARTGDRVTEAGRGRQRPAEHGTMRGYLAGCHAGDPCPATPTCAQVSAARRKRWRDAPARPIVHGKRQGYARGCLTPEQCPNYGTELPTCSEVGRAYGRARYAATKAAA